MTPAWQPPPVFGGILVGGQSRRFGRPKHLELLEGRTWLERAVAAVHPHVDGMAILGAGEVPTSLATVPVVPDVPGVAGPLAGMRAAMQWRPRVGWLFVACDLPLLSGNAVSWVLDHRAEAVRAILPRLPDAPGPEPLLAYYDPRAAAMVSQVRRPIDVGAMDRVLTPLIPDALQVCWTNVNTPGDLSTVHPGWLLNRRLSE